MEYKPPLTITEQIARLKSKKRVVFNCIDETSASSILYKSNYINVISPFKHCFAKVDDNKNPIKVNDEHVYERDVDFIEYSEKYNSERTQYPSLYKGIMDFESHFNAILSYEIIHAFNIRNSERFELFVDTLMENIKSTPYDDDVKNHMRSEIGKFKRKMNKYNSIYIFMDRLSLSASITVLRCCGKPLQKYIFSRLYDNNCTLGYEDFPTFDSDCLERIVKIRNCICHGNSLEVLLQYYDIKEKSFRTSSDRVRFKTILRKLKNNE
ncbi:MAG: Abi family protein [Lachnospiraceae bacterium]|nr:Abi family protein [Lachnospiraceae bacterium]